MNLIDAIFSILIIGIIVSTFGFLPQKTYENMHDSNQILEYSKMINEIDYAVQQIPREDMELFEELLLPEKIEEVKEKYTGANNQKLSVKGEVVEINEKSFVKVSLDDRKISQEYFFGLQTKE